MVQAGSRVTDRSLIVGLIVALTVVLIGGGLLTWAVWCVPPAALAVGLTNVATIGGIVSGLSLSGTAVFALSGRYAERVLARYSSTIRFILFGGFALVVLASLTCALAVVWAEQAWVRFLLGYTVAAAAATLITTSLLVNSAFAWRDADAQVPPRKDPLAGLTETDPTVEA